MSSPKKSVKIGRIGTTYLHKLTDDFSIWQHSKGKQINRSLGYALDDAARGLLAALAYSEIDLANIYLSFIEHAVCDFPDPVIFFSPNRLPLDRPISHDALGEAFWAVSAAKVKGMNLKKIKRIQENITIHLSTARSLRSLAYAALSHEPRFVRLFQDRLEQEWSNNTTDTWVWPEHTLSYANALIPLALIANCKNEDLLCSKAFIMLDFLNSTCTHDSVPTPIGNLEWHQKGGSRALFDQQPIDPAYQVWANALAYWHTKDSKYLQQAELFFSWFWGNNTAGLPLIDPDGERCFDGIHKNGISHNCGAENIVCYLITQAVYEEALKAESSLLISTLFRPIQ